MFCYVVSLSSYSARRAFILMGTKVNQPNANISKLRWWGNQYNFSGEGSLAVGKVLLMTMSKHHIKYRAIDKNTSLFINKQQLFFSGSIKLDNNRKGFM